MKDKRRYADRREYLIKAVSKRRTKVKEMTVKEKGGSCQRCGYSKCIDALEFHHLQEKNFGISKSGITRSWTKTKSELKKCLLVYANCHREIHASLKLQPQEEILE